MTADQPRGAPPGDSLCPECLYPGGVHALNCSARPPQQGDEPEPDEGEQRGRRDRLRRRRDPQ